MNIKKRQEVINLMPWYNLGKLSDAEKFMVDEALIKDPSLREQLSLDEDIMTKIVADPKLLDRSAFESSSVRLDKVLAQLDGSVAAKPVSEPVQAAPKKQRSPGVLTRVKSYFMDLLAGSSHSFTYAVFAALTVVQLALLMFFVVPSTMQKNADYTTASDGESKLAQAPALAPSTDNKISGLVLLVTMEDNIQTEGFTSKTLGDIKFDILPDDYGYYRVRLNKTLTPKEIEVLKNELSHKNAKVIFVGEEFQSQ